jgi:hypothetical protein
MQKQDLNKLQLRKIRALKRKTPIEDEKKETTTETNNNNRKKIKKE